MFILTAAAFFGFHAAVAALVIVCSIKFNARFFAHAIMHFHCNA